ncbi:unnamed protein product [Parascedosporium putredinis]|uniref:protein-tyrosine-phosphatase n=1 Tax=Parascedosporium putredinis TaxID=1442378 RepID=A0A9P1HCP3_9PEZI|nr:unnamed protein product [Parascedosporium putredinis]CAI8004039.1 unnamed protein product [Parascedosporium putredinis]
MSLDRVEGAKTSILEGFKPREMEGDATKGPTWDSFRKTAKHMMIDIDDVDDEDLLVHLPQAVRFIEEGLYPKESPSEDDDSSSGEDDSKPKGRFSSRKGGATEAVNGAIEWIRRSRSIADPNWGFRSQLKLWWEMGCPEDVESHPIYRKWAYKREIERSVACGMAPELRFEDEEVSRTKPAAGAETTQSAASAAEPELRCRKCRKTLATAPFIVALSHGGGAAAKTVEAHAPIPSGPCPHYFIEPLVDAAYPGARGPRGPAFAPIPNAAPRLADTLGRGFGARAASGSRRLSLCKGQSRCGDEGGEAARLTRDPDASRYGAPGKPVMWRGLWRST